MCKRGPDHDDVVDGDDHDYCGPRERLQSDNHNIFLLLLLLLRVFLAQPNHGSAGECTLKEKNLKPRHQECDGRQRVVELGHLCHSGAHSRLTAASARGIPQSPDHFRSVSAASTRFLVRWSESRFAS